MQCLSEKCHLIDSLASKLNRKPGIKSHPCSPIIAVCNKLILFIMPIITVSVTILPRESIVLAAVGQEASATVCVQRSSPFGMFDVQVYLEGKMKLYHKVKMLNNLKLSSF